METSTAFEDKAFAILSRIIGAGATLVASVVSIGIAADSACAIVSVVAIGLVATPVAAIIACLLPRNALVNRTLVVLAILVPIAVAMYGHSLPPAGECAF